MKTLLQTSFFKITLLFCFLGFGSVTSTFALGLSGTYTIGPSGTYTSFAAAITALTTNGISGQVIFNVAAGTYTGNISIPAITGAGVGNDSIIFNGGTAASCTLQTTSYANNGFVVELNSCSYVTFENFTITTTLSGFNFWGVSVEGPNSGSPATHDDVINCTINMANVSSATAVTIPSGSSLDGIVVSGWTTGDGISQTISGYFSNIYFVGNTITNGHFGIEGGGSVSSSPSGPSGVNIVGNTITGFTSQGIGFFNVINPKIKNNVINGGASSTALGANNARGISMNTAYNPSSTTDWTEISGNFITCFSRYGILLNGVDGLSSQPTRIYNNMIYMYGTTAGSAPAAGIGISTLNNTFSPGNNYINFWNNSIVLNLPSSQGALTIGTGATNEDIRNNILMYMGTSTGFAISLGACTEATAFDYNVFYNSTSTNEGNIGNPAATLATYTNSGASNIVNNNYGGGTNFNVHSVCASPNFVNTTFGSQNLHITALPVGCGKGDPSVLTASPMAVTTDYDGQTRGTPPIIGADELIVSSTPATATVCTGANQLLTAVPDPLWTPTSYIWYPGASTGSTYNPAVSATTTYTVSAIDAGGCTAAQGTSVITTMSCGFNIVSSVSGGNGSISPLGTTTVSTGGSQTYTFTPNTCYSVATVTVDGSTVTPAGTYTFSSVSTTHTISVAFAYTPVTITVSPSPGSFCLTGGTLTASGAGVSGTYTWSPSTHLSATTGAAVTATPTSSTTYTVTGTTSSGCTGSTTVVASPVTPLSGTYTINPSAGTFYPSSTAFASFSTAIAALTCAGINGQVTFNVSPGTYTGNISIPAITGAGVGNDSIIFNGGSAASCTMQETSYGNNGYLVEINNSAYVTFENFTLSTTLTAGYNFDGFIIEGNNSGSPISHVDILNCTINMLSESAAVFPVAGSTFSGIVVDGWITGDGVTPGISGYFANIYLNGNTINNGHYGILAYGATSASPAYNSTVNVVGNTLTSFSSYGTFMSGVSCPKIRNNVMNGCVSANSPIACIGMSGAANQSSTTDWVEISGNNLTSQGRYGGMYLNGACGIAAQPTRVYNNFVYLYNTTLTGLRAISTVNSTFSPGNSYMDFWNNSIVLNTPSTNANGALSFDNGALNEDIRNNIFAYIGSSTAYPLLVPTGATLTALDYNIYYNSASTASEASIFGTAYSNTTVIGGGGYNSNSVVANPNFVNTTFGTQDLHVTQQCKIGTFISTVTTDYDGQTRNNPPNIGADEVPLPVIGSGGTISGTASVCQLQNGVSYSVTPITNAVTYSWTLPSGYTIVGASTNNSITVNFSGSASSGNITVSGVGTCGNSAASSPFAVTVHAGPSVTISPSPASTCLSGSTITASGGSTTYTWAPSTGLGATTGASVLATIVTSTTYTITGINSSGCSNTNTVVASPTTPLSGAYTINPSAGTFYPSSTAFASFSTAIAALTCAGINGQVTFNVSPGTYTGNISIPAITGAGVGNDSIIFNGGSAATCTLESTSSSNNGYLVELNNSSYITFENFTLATTLTSGFTFDGVMIEGNNSGSPISHVDIINCTINMVSIAAAALNPGSGQFTGIVVDGWITGDGITQAISGYFSNIYLKGNTITNGHFGIITDGTNATPSGVNIVGNTITGFSSMGMDMLSVVCPKIRNNVINGGAVTTANGANNSRGIQMSSAANQSSTTDWVEISGNFITATCRYGILLNGACGIAAQPTRIYNNMVYMYSTVVTAAIGISTLNNTFSPGNNYLNIWNNSIVSNTPSTQGALLIGTGATNEDIRNNIFEYIGTSTGYPISLGACTEATAFDYNIFYNTASTNEGSIGNPAGTAATYTNSGATNIINNNYGGGTNFNVNSLVADPAFVNTTYGTQDLHVTQQCKIGTFISTVTTDYDGQTRNNPPNIGADEIPVPAVIAGTITGTATVCQLQNGVVYSVAPITNAVSYNWTVPSGYNIVGAATNNSITVNFSGAATSGSISVSGVNVCGTVGTASSPYAITVHTSPSITITPSPASTCLSGSAIIASGGSTYAWAPSTGLSATTGATVTATIGTTVTYTVTGTSSFGCSITNTVVASPATPMSGTYNIDPAASGAQLYANGGRYFTDLPSSVAALTCAGISAPVTVKVTAASYTCSTTVIVNPINGAGGHGGADSIIFDGVNAATSILTQSSPTNNNTTFWMLNASYITLKNFTVTAASPINAANSTYNFWGVAIVGSNSGSPISHDDVINCIVSMATQTATAATGPLFPTQIGIVVDGESATNSNAMNVSGYFQNIYLNGNTITNGHHGIYVFGDNTTPPSGVYIVGNTVTGFSTIGINLNNIYLPKVRNNVVNGGAASTANGANVARAIAMNTAYNPGSTTDWVEISGNFITAYCRYGILLGGANGTSAQPTRIFNNMIYMYGTTAGSGPAAARGISTLNSTFSPGNNFINYWNNSIVMNTISTVGSGALSLDNGAANSDIRNNILAYIGPSTGLPILIPTLANVTAFDYNIFYNSSPTPTNEGSIGGNTYISTPGITCIINSNYGGGTTFNIHSVCANPFFVNTTLGSQDLHVTQQCNRGDPFVLTSTPMAVTTDYDGQTRPWSGQTQPNIGADEIVGNTPTVSVPTPSLPSAICSGNNINLSSSCSVNCTSMTYTWSPSTGLNATTGSSVTATLSTAGNYTYTVTGTNNFGCTASANSVAITVNANPTPSITEADNSGLANNDGIICNLDAATLTANPSGLTYSWSAGLGSNRVVTTSPSVTSTYTVTVTDGNSCTATTSNTVTVNQLPLLVVTPNNAVCTGGTTATLVASGASTYTWSPTTNLTPSAGTTATETAQISALTIYTVTGTGTNGCSINTQVPVATVAVGGTISAPFSIICSGTTKPLSVIGAAGHDYQWQISTDNLTWTNITGATNTTYTTAGSDGTTNKFYRLLAQSNSCWNVASTTAEVDVSVPTIPVTATGITDNSLTLNWSPVGTGNYTISYSGPTSATLTSVTPSKTITGLTANGTYSITVTQTGLACAASGTITGVNTLCAMPIGVTLSSPASSQILVSWTGVGGADYRVYYRPLFSYNTYFTKDVSNASSVLLKLQGNNNLYASTTYEVYVSRLDCPTTGALGQGTSPTNVTTLPTVSCATPSIDSVRSLCPVQIEVFLHPGSSPTNNYNIYIQRITPTILAVNSYGVTGNYFTINVPYSGDQFLIAAESKCTGGGLSALYVWPGNLTIKPLCSSLPNLVLSNPTCHGFTASWNADPCLSNSSSGYELDLRVQGTLGYNSYGAPLPVAPVGPNKLVNWATAGRTYQVFVRSIYNCNGYVTYGPASQTLSITTLSSGCRDEETNQPEETKPAAQQYAPSNDEVFTLYPNPNNGKFVADLSRYSNEEDAVRIEVINLIGQTIMTHLTTISGGHMSEFINLPTGTAAGTYIVRLTAGKNVYTTKINVSK